MSKLSTSIVKCFAGITKSEEQADGTIKVWGYASTGAEDSDGETITADCMKAALPDYLKFSNVREMHQSKAAGVCIEANVGEDGKTFFGAHIVDKEAAAKVRAGVYKGFSIGGKVLPGGRDPANPKIIKSLKLVEVSLVDRPANPEALFTFFKAETLDETEEVTLRVPDAVAEFAKSEAGQAALTEFLTKQAAELAATAAAEAEAVAKAAAEAKVVADKAAADKIAKGMGHVAQLAMILKAITSLVQDQVAEMTREGDASSVPSGLQAWLDQGGAILVAMATEEASELSAEAQIGQQDWNTPSAIYLAERALGILKGQGLEGVLTKAGAKFSATTKAALAKAHSAMKDACSHLDGTGYAAKAGMLEGDVVAKADLTKLLTELDATKAELATTADALNKSKADFETLATESTALAKAHAELLKQPAPAKGRTRVIEKGDDTNDLTKTATAKITDPTDAVKAIHAQGGSRLVC